MSNPLICGDPYHAVDYPGANPGYAHQIALQEHEHEFVELTGTTSVCKICRLIDPPPAAKDEHDCYAKRIGLICFHEDPSQLRAPTMKEHIEAIRLALWAIEQRLKSLEGKMSERKHMMATVVISFSDNKQSCDGFHEWNRDCEHAPKCVDRGEWIPAERGPAETVTEECNLIAAQIVTDWRNSKQGYLDLAFRISLALRKAATAVITREEKL